MMTRLMLCLVCCLTGCSAPGVRCDSHLEPINAAGPNSVSAAAHSGQKVP